MTHGIMYNRLDEHSLHFWCLCSEWSLVVQLSSLPMTEGMAMGQPICFMKASWQFRTHLLEVTGSVSGE